MEPSGYCPSCNQPLPADAPLGGLCPQCLIRSGFYSGTAPESTARGKFAAPGIDELVPLFPQLEILELIGRGGMGAVYKARQPRLNRFVAIKILAREHGADVARFAERFQREAQALARMNHPNIVTVYDFGEAGGYFYLMMEFVDGLNLRQLERARKMAPAEALAIVPPICDALQYAHQQGIVHRDIKPENILLDKDGRVKIADFGIAKILGAGPDEHLTGEQQRVGTPLYMAPEQVEKPTTVDHRADIYSLGVVFYEMLTGELPLGRFQPPSKKVQIDVRLDDIVLRALEKEPELRYQQASEIRTRVETLASGPDVASDESVSAEERRHRKSGLIGALIPMILMLALGHRIVHGDALVWWYFGFGVGLLSILYRMWRLNHESSSEPGKPSYWELRRARRRRSFGSIWGIFILLLIVTIFFPDFFPLLWRALPGDNVRIGVAVAILAILLLVELREMREKEVGRSAALWSVLTLMVAVGIFWPRVFKELQRLAESKISQHSERNRSSQIVIPSATLSAGSSDPQQAVAAGQDIATTQTFPDEPAMHYNSGPRARLVAIVPVGNNKVAWDLNGSPVELDLRQFQIMPLGIKQQEELKEVSLLMVIDQFPNSSVGRNEVSYSFKSKDTAWSNKSVKSLGASDLVSITAAFPATLEETSLSLGIAAGSWATAASGGLHSFSSTAARGNSTLEIMATYLEQSGKLRFITSDNATDEDYRLIARDIEGNVYVATRSESSSSMGMRQTTFDFEIPDGALSIEKVEFQLRGYEWHDISGIPLSMSKEQENVARWRYTKPVERFPAGESNCLDLDGPIIPFSASPEYCDLIFRTGSNGDLEVFGHNLKIGKVADESWDSMSAAELFAFKESGLKTNSSEGDTRLRTGTYIFSTALNSGMLRLADASTLRRLDAPLGILVKRIERDDGTTPTNSTSTSLQKPDSAITELITESIVNPIRNYAFQSTSPYKPPDFKSYFPDGGAPSGDRLLALWNSPDKDSRSADEILGTVWNGLRRIPDNRMQILRWIGNKYIWNQPVQDPRAIEIMYHAAETPSNNADPYGTRGPAIYFGLSVVKDKTPAILHTLVDICMKVDDPNDLDRIAWGTESQRYEMMKYLKPYLESHDQATSEKAETVRKILTGELKAFQWATERAKSKATANYANELPSLKQALTTGTSIERMDALKLILRENLALIMDESFIPAFGAAGTDEDPRVRREIARTAGERWVWSADKQSSAAIALMLKLSHDADRDVRYNAVYFGLSTVRNKDETVVRRLLEMAMADREPNTFHRIIWGLKSDREAARSLLDGYINSGSAEATSAREIYNAITGEEAPVEARP